MVSASLNPIFAYSLRAAPREGLEVSITFPAPTAAACACAARTSAYYAVAPFMGTALSLLIFREVPHYTFFIALAVMAVGAWLAADDKPLFRKRVDPPA